MKDKENIAQTVNIDETQSCTTEPVTPVAGCCGGEPAELTEPVNTESTSCCGDSNSTSYGNNRLLTALTPFWTAWTLIPLIPLVVFILDGDQLQQVISISTTALGGTIPYILFAVLLLAYLKASNADSMVAQAFQGRENRMIVLAALFGGLAPFCSCEVIPFIAGLLALGAPVSAVMAFWLSSPLIDPPSLMITAGALGWDFAIGKALAAIFLGLFGGFGIKLLMNISSFKNPLKKESASGCSTGECSTETPFSTKPNWKFWNEQSQRHVFVDQGFENALFLFKWLSLAYLLEALLIIYIPASLIGSIVGGEGFGPIVLGAIVGMPAYLNSYAAPPLVSGLMEQGMSAGSAMAFMVAGAISSIPAMTAVWSLVKRPVFFAYLGFGVSGAIVFGAAFAYIYNVVGIFS